MSQDTTVRGGGLLKIVLGGPCHIAQKTYTNGHKSGRAAEVAAPCNKLRPQPASEIL
tara:strand:- start:335 stop:505 length:171 start_codon:yes stop_codon:yes gene_type:complete